MQGMRTLLRHELARSLRSLPEVDRLAAALPVVCGSVLAAHCQVVEIDDRRTVRIEVSGADWLAPLLGMRDVLERDLAKTAGVTVYAVDLYVPRNRPRFAAAPAPPAGKPSPTPQIRNSRSAE